MATSNVLLEDKDRILEGRAVRKKIWPLAFKRQFTSFSSPTPDSLMQPHTITLPPPCFNVGSIQSSRHDSPGLHQTNALPMFLKSWNHDLSLKTTLDQLDSIVFIVPCKLKPFSLVFFGQKGLFSNTVCLETNFSQSSLYCANWQSQSMMNDQFCPDLRCCLFPIGHWNLSWNPVLALIGYPFSTSYVLISYWTSFSLLFQNIVDTSNCTTYLFCYFPVGKAHLVKSKDSSSVFKRSARLFTVFSCLTHILYWDFLYLLKPATCRNSNSNLSLFDFT